MKYVEQAGLVKFDFLGLTTLTILQRAIGFLTDKPDLDRLPLDDKPTYEMLARRAMRAGCSSSSPPACGTCCARCGRTGSRT